MKKSQIQSQVFVFIFLGIVAAVTIYFGFTFISKMIDTDESAQLLQFTNDLPKKMNVGYGSSDVYFMDIPSGYSVCFVNTTDTGITDLLLQDVVSRDNTTYVYLTGKGVEKIKTDVEVRPYNVTSDSYDTFCIKSSEANKRIYIEGMGGYVRVRRYNE